MTVEGITSALRRASRVVVPLDPMEISIGPAPAITLAAAMRDLKLTRDWRPLVNSQRLRINTFALAACLPTMFSQRPMHYREPIEFASNAV